MFPRAWLLLVLLVFTGRTFLSAVRLRTGLAVLGVVVAASAAEAARRWSSYRMEPPQVLAHAVIHAGALYSSAPAVRRDGVIYQSMTNQHFVLRTSRAGTVRTLELDGEAFHPAVPAGGEPVYFEWLTGGHSRIGVVNDAGENVEVAVRPDPDAIEPAVSPDGSKLAFISGRSLFVVAGGVRSLLANGNISHPTFFPDGRRIAFTEGLPGSRSIRFVQVLGGPWQSLVEGGDCFEPAISPDGRRLAFVCSETGARQVWVEELGFRARRRITSGACHNDSPAWRRDSGAILLASDCSRGLGLPALYWAPLP